MKMFMLAISTKRVHKVSFPGPFTETKPNLMEDLLEQIQQVLSCFSTNLPMELRHLSYRGTNFCILCRRNLAPGIGITVTSSPPVILKMLTLTVQEFLEV